MKINEKPILFSGEMVRAILDGRKVQTRRVVKLPARLTDRGKYASNIKMCTNVSGHWSAYDSNNNLTKSWEMIKTPYGKTGDRLWVRETWKPLRLRTPEQEEKIKAWFEKGDHSNFMNEQDEWAPMPDGEMSAMYAADFGDWAYDIDSDLKPWKPSIFMPRWASRINLEITGVRVERLQEISEADAKAEGVDAIPSAPAALTHRTSFAGLWNKINGKKHPWESNSWVWVVEFKRVQA